MTRAVNRRVRHGNSELSRGTLGGAHLTVVSDTVENNDGEVDSLGQARYSALVRQQQNETRRSNARTVRDSKRVRCEINPVSASCWTVRVELQCRRKMLIWIVSPGTRASQPVSKPFMRKDLRSSSWRLVQDEFLRRHHPLQPLDPLPSVLPHPLHQAAHPSSRSSPS
jgi:hypothetical protein